MQALNSMGYTRKSLAAAGIGMFIAFLFLAPLATYAASSTVTVTTDKTFYAAGTDTIHVSGTISPAPGVSGTFVAVSISGPNGAGVVDENEFAVNSATGAFNGTFVTGGPTYATQGIYSISANYNGATGSATFQYGNTTTGGSSQTGATTTVFVDSTLTVSSVVTSVTTIVSSAVTTVSSVAQTTTTQVNDFTTTVSATGGSDSTALAIGAVGVIIAIIAAVLAVLAMRKK